MHRFSFVIRYRKHDTTKRSRNTSFCNYHMRIAISTSYRIWRRNVFVEYRCYYHLHFSEQCEYLYRNSDGG